MNKEDAPVSELGKFALVTRQLKELQDWREMVEAFVALPLPEELRPRKLWPNSWHQDCALIAFALHNLSNSNQNAGPETKNSNGRDSTDTSKA